MVDQEGTSDGQGPRHDFRRHPYRRLPALTADAAPAPNIDKPNTRSNVVLGFIKQSMPPKDSSPAAISVWEALVRESLVTLTSRDGRLPTEVVGQLIDTLSMEKDTSALEPRRLLLAVVLKNSHDSSESTPFVDPERVLKQYVKAVKIHSYDEDRNFDNLRVLLDAGENIADLGFFPKRQEALWKIAQAYVLMRVAHPGTIRPKVDELKEKVTQMILTAQLTAASTPIRRQVFEARLRNPNIPPNRMTDISSPIIVETEISWLTSNGFLERADPELPYSEEVYAMMDELRNLWLLTEGSRYRYSREDLAKMFGVNSAIATPDVAAVSRVARVLGLAERTRIQSDDRQLTRDMLTYIHANNPSINDLCDYFGVDRETLITLRVVTPIVREGTVRGYRIGYL